MRRSRLVASAAALALAVGGGTLAYRVVDDPATSQRTAAPQPTAAPQDVAPDEAEPAPTEPAPAPSPQQPTPEPDPQPVEPDLSDTDQDAPAPGTQVLGKTRLAELPVPVDPTEGAEQPRTASVAPQEREPFELVGVTWAGTDGDATAQVRVRQSGTWTDWIDLDAGTAADGAATRGGTDPWWVGASDAVEARVQSTGDALPQDIRVVTVDGGAEEADADLPAEPAPAASGDAVTEGGVTEGGALEARPATYSRSATIDGVAQAEPTAVAAPTIISRSAWGASSGTSCSSPIYGTIRGVMIHHTAGSNSYTKAQSASIMRGMQSYHVNGQGWCDIGYNFVVDKYGQIFEGRKGGTTKMVRGAHSGVGDVNRDVVGISMMGNYDTTGTTKALQDAVTRLASWRLSIAGLPGKGTFSLGGRTIQRVSMHREVKSTACPGRYGVQWVTMSGGLRDRVAAAVAGGGSTPSGAPVTGLRATEVGARTIAVSWTAVPGAASYRVSTSQRSSTPTCASGECKTSTTTSTSRTVTGNGLTYHVNVQPLDAAGQPMSPWMATPLTVQTLAPPVTTLRTTSVTAGTIAVRWSAVTGATRYRVSMSQRPGEPTCSTGECRVVTGVELSRGVSGGGSTYYVNVQPVDASGGPLAAWRSTPVTVRTLTAKVAGLRLVSVSAGNLSVEWNQVANADAYRVSTSQKSGAPACATGECRIVTGTELARGVTGSGRTYYVNVQPVDEDGTARAGWLTTPLKVTTPTTGVSGLRATSVTAGKITVVWNGYPGAARYRVSTSQTSGAPACATGECREVTGTTLARGVAGGGRTYYVNVQPLSASGSPLAGWTSTPLVVRTLTAKVSGLRTTSTTATTIAVAWNAVPNAGRYRVSTSQSKGAPTCGTGECQEVTTTRLSRGVSAAGRTYYVNVQPIDAAGKARAAWLSVPLAVTTKAASSGTSARDTLTVPSSRSISLEGRGYGHGIGMSQNGAQGAAVGGWTWQKILSHYYPGTTLSTTSAQVRVQISAATSSAVNVLHASGLRVRRVNGGHLTTLPGTVSGRAVDAWRIDLATDRTQSVLKYRSAGTWRTYGSAWTGAAQFEGPSTLRLILPNGTTRTYRGAMRSLPPSDGATTRLTVNVLSLDDYVRGVLPREMPAGWDADALRAGAVAARTYAAHQLKPSARFDLCDTTACQVYGGLSAEQGSTNTAVTTTARQILTYGGKPAFTQYSASSGGYTNQGSQPYLKPVSDGWDSWSGNPNRAWTATVSAATLERARPSIGTLRQLKVVKRSGLGPDGGRVVSLQLVGSKSTATLTGPQARSAMGLKSDWFGF